MSSWIEVDETGNEYLVRSGSGSVLSLTPVGLVGPQDEHTFYLVKLEVREPSPPAALHYRAVGHVRRDDGPFSLLQQAWSEGSLVSWVMRWQRHDWVPRELPVLSLDHVADTRAEVIDIRKCESDIRAPLFVPEQWAHDHV
jgi:hypothetical protein